MNDWPSGRSDSWLNVRVLPAISVVLLLDCSAQPPPRTPADPLLPEQAFARLPEPPLPPEPVIAAAPEPEPEPPARPVDPLPLVAADEVALWRDGEQVEILARELAETRGLQLLDVGTDWAPQLFRSTPEVPHDYAPLYVDLANGRFDQSTDEGRRAAWERYLEAHGIPPSPLLLMHRFDQLSATPCSTNLRLGVIRELESASWASPASASPEAVEALRARLECEGHLRVTPSGQLDEDTRAALEEFERRNRIYARGVLRGPTLAALQREPLELERESLVRVLTERLVLDLGVIEDGSACGVLPERRSGRVEDAPDVVQRIRQRVIASFGLDTVEGLRRFYARMKEALATAHYGLALDAVGLPDYYGHDMELWIEIDRGDFYYDFPFDADGAPRDFHIQKGPTLVLFARDAQQHVRPLAQYRTTIGGWRIRQYGDRELWEYKESPPGARVWARLIAAPVWLPPRSTPEESLLITLRRTQDGSTYRELNRNLIGPSFASAYGLLAAHHRRFGQTSDRDFELRGDEGIRTHGTADYTSIGRPSSSGCHRLHNHLAMRLFSFLLAHRVYQRTGHGSTQYRVAVNVDGREQHHSVWRTGYGFDLERPIEVEVLNGRALGAAKRRLRERIPVDTAQRDEWRRVAVEIEPEEGGWLEADLHRCRVSAP